MRQVTERSFGVPDAVNSGQVGVGVVIDFFAFSRKAAGFPVEFVYPTVTPIVPANIAHRRRMRRTRRSEEAFVEFLLSPDGQEMLLDPAIPRLPVLPAIYAKAPAGYPNPFRDSVKRCQGFQFNVDLSERALQRCVDSLFDQIDHLQPEPLKTATRRSRRGSRAGEEGQCRKRAADRA